MGEQGLQYSLYFLTSYSLYIYLSSLIFQGAIFSVNYCPKSNLIVSTSDDRTVRFWKVNFKTENDWTTANIALTSTIFGHTARVWQSAILNDSKNKNIISVGEVKHLTLWLLFHILNILDYGVLEKWNPSSILFSQLWLIVLLTSTDNSKARPHDPCRGRRVTIQPTNESTYYAVSI